MLRESELRALQTLQQEMSITELAAALDCSTSYTSEITSSLKEKELVYTRRDGKEKRVKPVENQAVKLFQRLAQTHSHIDFPDLISGKAIPLLYYLDTDRTVAELAEKTGNYRNTVNRVLKQLLNRGILRKQDTQYRLNDEFQILHDFSREYIHHVHRRTVAEYTHDFTILWELLEEFLIQTGDVITHDSFVETGPSQFQQHGLPLVTTGASYYFFSEDVQELTAQDLICHTLLIEESTRYQTYCLLLIQKENLESGRLLEVAEKYDVENTVQQLIDYLDTSGDEKSPSLPSWEEFQSAAADYEVAV
jgi:DNA-binding MarR family transcriptional regulator